MATLIRSYEEWTKVPLEAIFQVIDGDGNQMGFVQKTLCYNKDKPFSIYEENGEIIFCPSFPSMIMGCLSSEFWSHGHRVKLWLLSQDEIYHFSAVYQHLLERISYLMHPREKARSVTEYEARELDSPRRFQEDVCKFLLDNSAFVSGVWSTVKGIEGFEQNELSKVK